MKRRELAAVLGLAALLSAGSWAHAQNPPAPAQTPQQGDKQQPAQKPDQKPAGEANPFPEDTGNVPVLPSANQPVPREAPSPAGPPPAMPRADVDPVRSPDEPLPEPSAASSSGESSSSADLANILAPPPDEETRKPRKGKNEPAPEHKETAKEDENVGQYYLGQKNWRAALSRYQSALVLDPENPDVYWGLAESQRHLGDVANARTNYMKVMEYDPGSKHAKEARKLLSEPEMAGASAAPVTHP